MMKIIFLIKTQQTHEHDKKIIKIKKIKKKIKKKNKK